MDSLDSLDSLSLDRRRSTRAESASRRTRLRLRDLCDEVLASYRVAKGHDPVSAVEREDARSLLSRVAPQVPTPRG
jgi:hypothetical protein